MALVQGTKKRKSEFFVVTKTALARGYLFLTGDRPSEDTFRNLIESVPFFSESEDRAREEDNTSALKNLQGLSIAANDQQVINRQAKSQVKTWAVQPSQVTEVAEDTGDVEIGTEAGAYSGPVASVSRDTGTTTHNRYLVTLLTAFTTWLGGFYDSFIQHVAFVLPRLVPTGGTTGQYLAKLSGDDNDVGWVDPCCDNVTGFSLSIAEDIPDDADIVCWYDTSSFSGQSRVDAQNLMETWYSNYVASKPNFQGRLIQLQRSNEDWVNFANLYVDAAQSISTFRVWTPDGLGSFTTTPNFTITDPTNKKVVMIVFLDEANSIYHGASAATMQDPPTATFRTHYNDFVNTQYAKYDFFRAIMYAVQSGGPTGTTANLHSNVVQAIEPSTLVAAPFSFSVANAGGFNGTQLDFITANNIYEQAVDGASPSGYSGLRDYGWTYVIDMPNGSVNSVTNTEFADDVANALAGGDGNKTVTITGLITLQSGATFSSSVAFDVPV